MSTRSWQSNESLNDDADDLNNSYMSLYPDALSHGAHTAAGNIPEKTAIMSDEGNMPAPLGLRKRRSTGQLLSNQDSSPRRGELYRWWSDKVED